ncbi:N-6 DNA methylase [Streptomyces sp. Tu 2975]|uniref:N-6 DNA methylase n=1 Tax=Streptomyces sp. Tu 2975 TaxID=2676871 RepID=UPI001FC9F812|nr:N-6 DNA methylase [Streptomyces sp. Tu 2975]
MPQPSAQVTAAEISRIAGVTRATVSNWRRRHEDFPAPAGGTESSPLYELEAVRAWLESRGQISAATPSEELRTRLRLHPAGSGAAARLLPLVLAAAPAAKASAGSLRDLPDTELVGRAEALARDLAAGVPGAEEAGFDSDDTGALRALLRCVDEESGLAALDVLAERELDDSASSGTYPTPEPLADLMARLVGPPSAGTSYPAHVLDPACGSGTLLEAAARRGATDLYGQDAVPVQAQRAAVRLRLTRPDADLTARIGDSLRADAFPGLAADAVLCNPPYGDRDWGHEELAYDPRWAFGVPARAEPELAWVQHALSHLRPGGHAVLLLPPATAARASGRRVRAELIRTGAVRAVVALPAGAAVPLHIGLQLWVLQHPDAGAAGRTAVLFVDTAGTADTLSDDTGRPRRRREPLDWAALTRTVLRHWDAFRSAPGSFTGEPGAARAVPAVELLDELVDLTPARHVRAAREDADPAEVARQAGDHLRQLALRADVLGEEARRGAWQPAADGRRREWRTAAVSDLARGGALEILRAGPPGKGGPAAAAWREEHADRPVLTGADIARGEPGSGSVGDLSADSSPVVEAGDVLIRIVRGGSGTVTRVADEGDRGAVLGSMVVLLRPDPSRLDPSFLAGFLEADDNLAGASTGSTTVQVQPGRLRVPLLPLEQQRRYGEAFRRVRALRRAADQSADLARRAAGLLTGGLTSGALEPPEAAGTGS